MNMVGKALLLFLTSLMGRTFINCSGPLLAPNATEKASESASEVVPAAFTGTASASGLELDMYHLRVNRFLLKAILKS